MKYIFALGKVPEEKAGTVGGKALSLDRMIKYLKLPIPEGYAISEEAFCRGEILPEAKAEIDDVTDCLIREADRQAVFIGLGVSDDGFDPHFAACPDDAEGDLATIGNQDFIEHSELRDRIGF